MGMTARPHLRPIPGFDGYAADAEGNIWSCRRAWKAGRWRKLSLWADPKGYPLVTLQISGRLTARRVSHLVLLAFVGPRPEGTEACHFPDPDPRNNRPENLRWDTKSENAQDALRMGRRPVGSRAYRAKLSERDVVEILRLLDQGETQAGLARRLGVSRTLIRKIAAGECWRHITARREHATQPD